MKTRALAVVLVLVCLASPAASSPQDPSGDKPVPTPKEAPFLTWGDKRIYFGFDLSFASVQDESLRAAMGRERRIKPAFAIISAYGDLGDYLSYRVEINPVDDSVVPRPYRLNCQKSDGLTRFERLCQLIQGGIQIIPFVKNGGKENLYLRRGWRAMCLIQSLLEKLDRPTQFALVFLDGTQQTERSLPGVVIPLGAGSFTCFQENWLPPL